MIDETVDEKKCIRGCGFDLGLEGQVLGEQIRRHMSGRMMGDDMSSLDTELSGHGLTGGDVPKRLGLASQGLGEVRLEMGCRSLCCFPHPPPPQSSTHPLIPDCCPYSP